MMKFVAEKKTLQKKRKRTKAKPRIEILISNIYIEEKSKSSEKLKSMWE